MSVRPYKPGLPDITKECTWGKYEEKIGEVQNIIRIHILNLIELSCIRLSSLSQPDQDIS